MDVGAVSIRPDARKSVSLLSLSKGLSLLGVWQDSGRNRRLRLNLICWDLARSASIMVRDINPVKTNDFFYLFLIHVMIMQALSNNVAGLQMASSHVCPLCESRSEWQSAVDWIYKWRGAAGRTNSSISDSVWLEFVRD